MKAISVRDPYSFVLVAAIGAFVYVMVVNTWVVDDAYITMRTVDNWVNGYGLTWNTSERVQAYTHPLWMLLLSALYFFTRESYFTILVACFVVSLCAVAVSTAIVTRDFRGDIWKAGLLLLAFAASKAVMDYTSWASRTRSRISSRRCTCGRSSGARSTQIRPTASRRSSGHRSLT